MFFAGGTQLRKHFGRPRTPKSQYNDSQAFRVCAVSGGGAGGGGEGADCANAERFLGLALKATARCHCKV